MGNDLAGRHRFDTFFFCPCGSSWDSLRLSFPSDKDGDGAGWARGSRGEEDLEEGGGWKTQAGTLFSFFLFADRGVQATCYRHPQAVAGTCGRSQAPSEASDCLFSGAGWGSWADFQVPTRDILTVGLTVDCSGLGGCFGGSGSGTGQAHAQARDKMRITMGLTGTCKLTLTGQSRDWHLTRE